MAKPEINKRMRYRRSAGGFADDPIEVLPSGQFRRVNDKKRVVVDEPVTVTEVDGVTNTIITEGDNGYLRIVQPNRVMQATRVRLDELPPEPEQKSFSFVGNKAANRPAALQGVNRSRNFANELVNPHGKITNNAQVQIAGQEAVNALPPGTSDADVLDIEALARREARNRKAMPAPGTARVRVQHTFGGKPIGREIVGVYYGPNAQTDTHFVQDDYGNWFTPRSHEIIDRLPNPEDPVDQEEGYRKSFSFIGRKSIPKKRHRVVVYAPTRSSAYRVSVLDPEGVDRSSVDFSTRQRALSHAQEVAHAWRNDPEFFDPEILDLSEVHRGNHAPDGPTGFRQFEVGGKAVDPQAFKLGLDYANDQNTPELAQDREQVARAYARGFAYPPDRQDTEEAISRSLAGEYVDLGPSGPEIGPHPSDEEDTKSFSFVGGKAVNQRAMNVGIGRARNDQNRDISAGHMQDQELYAEIAGEEAYDVLSDGIHYLEDLPDTSRAAYQSYMGQEPDLPERESSDDVVPFIIDDYGLDEPNSKSFSFVGTKDHVTIPTSGKISNANPVNRALNVNRKRRIAYTRQIANELDRKAGKKSYDEQGNYRPKKGEEVRWRHISGEGAVRQGKVTRSALPGEIFDHLEDEDGNENWVLPEEMLDPNNPSHVADYHSYGKAYEPKQGDRIRYKIGYGDVTEPVREGSYIRKSPSGQYHHVGVGEDGEGYTLVRTEEILDPNNPSHAADYHSYGKAMPPDSELDEELERMRLENMRDKFHESNMAWRNRRVSTPEEHDRREMARHFDRLRRERESQKALFSILSRQQKDIRNLAKMMKKLIGVKSNKGKDPCTSTKGSSATQRRFLPGSSGHRPVHGRKGVLGNGPIGVKSNKGKDPNVVRETFRREALAKYPDHQQFIDDFIARSDGEHQDVGLDWHNWSMEAHHEYLDNLMQEHMLDNEGDD